MTVIPLNRRTADKLAELRAEPLAQPEPTHVTLSPGARNAMTALEARVSELKRIFAGPSTPAAMAARIEELTNAVQSEAARVRRMSR